MTDTDASLIRLQELEYRQSDLNYQHAVCDAHPELEHLRPDTRIYGAPGLFDGMKTEEDEFDPYPLSPTTMKDAARMCAHKHGCTVQELIGRCRKWSLTKPRAEFVRICRKNLGKTYPEIARYMSDRDHSSVMHYWNQSELLVAA